MPSCVSVTHTRAPPPQAAFPAVAYAFRCPRGSAAAVWYPRRPAGKLSASHAARPVPVNFAQHQLPGAGRRTHPPLEAPFSAISSSRSSMRPGWRARCRRCTRRRAVGSSGRWWYRAYRDHVVAVGVHPGAKECRVVRPILVEGPVPDCRTDGRAHSRTPDAYSPRRSPPGTAVLRVDRLPSRYGLRRPTLSASAIAEVRESENTPRR